MMSQLQLCALRVRFAPLASQYVEEQSYPRAVGSLSAWKTASLDRNIFLFCFAKEAYTYTRSKRKLSN